MTDEEIQKLNAQYHVPAHVRRHCQAVCDFALKLGYKLLEKGENINLNLLKSAALIHDVVRIVDFKDFTPAKFPDPVTEEDIRVWKELREKYKNRHHSDVGADILKERGFDLESHIVRQHKFLQILEGFDSWEAKLLYYADKRTKHGQIVPLLERLINGQLRNAPETIGSEESNKVTQKVFELEEEIFKKIGERM